MSVYTRRIATMKMLNALVKEVTKNGSFNDGTTGYTIYVDLSAKA